MAAGGRATEQTAKAQGGDFHAFDHAKVWPISGTIVALTTIVLLLPFVQHMVRRRFATA